jgi:capsular polysaccharide transport system permease protein
MSLAAGLAIQRRVINAVILREVRTRFGRHQLGYIWAFAESLFWVLTFAGIHYAMGAHPPAGMDLLAFFATGIITFILFRSTLSRCQASIIGNRPLLFFPQVRPLDVATARAMLEAATLLAVFVGLLGANALWIGELSIDAPLRVLLGLGGAWLLGLGLGMCALGLSVYFPVTDQIVPILLRPLFFISGLFFTLNDLPGELRDYLVYNPVIHAVELVRDGWFVGYQANYVDLWYLGGWILFTVYAGLLLERFARRRVELT